MVSMRLGAPRGGGMGGAMPQQPGRGVFLGVEIEEVLAEFLLGDLIGRCAIVLGQLLDGVDIDGLGLGGEAAQLQVFEHASA